MVTNAVAPWRSAAELVEGALESGDAMRTVAPNETERAAIRAHLESAGIRESDLDWMSASCPSLRTARRLYPTRNP